MVPLTVTAFEENAPQEAILTREMINRLKVRFLIRKNLKENLLFKDFR